MRDRGVVEEALVVGIFPEDFFDEGQALREVPLLDVVGAKIDLGRRIVGIDG